jgi:hypothetical protein
MLLSELTIIYLAAAAPFGVARFLGEHARGAHGQTALLKATGAALMWPFTSLPVLLKRAASRLLKERADDEGHGADVQRVEQVKRAAVNALRAVEDLLADMRGLRSDAERHTLFAARESVERYAGLALACASARAEADPSPREMELCRIAGGAGDDLLVAGRCVHRRNVTRLVAHRERARAELIHALAAVRELAHALNSESAQRSNPESAQRSNTPARLFHSTSQVRSMAQVHSTEHSHCTEQTGDKFVERVSEAMLHALSLTIELPALFDDRATTVGVARLLDAECARLRRVEARGGAATTHAAAREGEDPCTTQAVPTAFVGAPLRTTTSHGG